MTKYSIVIPVYNNHDSLEPLYEDIMAALSQRGDFEPELVMVDDGSKDDSYSVMCRLAQRDSRVKIYRLSRNFGSHAAILCGLSNCTGDCAAVKAADLQEPSSLLLEMLDSWKKGNNVVLAVREGRADASFFPNLYYGIIRRFALPNMPKKGFDVFLLDRKVIGVLEALDEKNSAITGQLLWSGFQTDQIYYTRQERTIGKSQWTLKKKIRLVMDTLFSFSNVPITVVTWVGTLSCAASLIWAIVVLVSKLAGKVPVQGYTTLIIFQLFSFGVIMLTLGILGNYIWRGFDAARHRPVYIVEKDPQKDKPER